MKRASIINVLYLPIIFLGYGFLLGIILCSTINLACEFYLVFILQYMCKRITILSENFTGTVYLQSTEPFLIMSGFCVYSVASALFMFPAMYTFYTRAIDIYTFEHADGSGRATDLVIQPFVRFISMAFFPVIICAGVLYILVRSKLHFAFHCIFYIIML